MKKLILVVLALYSNTFLGFAQPHILWQKTFGGSMHDFASEIIQTNDGGYMIAGYSDSNDSDLTVNYGGRDWWIAKIDSVGGIQWQKSLGGSADDVLFSINQTTDNGYILSGYSESNDSDLTFNHGHRDCWIVKLDNSGNIQHQKCFGGSDFEIAYSILQTPDGGYIFGGYTNSGDGDLTITNSAQDYWIGKLDTTFNLDWYHRYGGQFTDEANSIQQTSDSGYILTGYAYSTNGHVTGHIGMQDCWVVKTNSVGALQWQKSLGGTDDERGYVAQQTSDGGYIVVTITSSNDHDVTGNHGWDDGWIVKLDSSGSISWEKSFGGTTVDGLSSIKQLSDGGFILAGYSNSNDGDVSGNNGDYDCWVVRLDNNGNILWQKCLGGTSHDNGLAVLQSSDGGFLVLGDTYSNDGDVTGHKGGSDIWLVKLDSAENVGVNEIRNSISDFRISPNPFSDETIISLQLSSSENIRIEICDMEGRIIKNLSAKNSVTGANKMLWDGTSNEGSRVVDGVYFVMISSENFRETRKVVFLRK